MGFFDDIGKSLKKVSVGNLFGGVGDRILEGVGGGERREEFKVAPVGQETLSPQQIETRNFLIDLLRDKAKAPGQLGPIQDIIRGKITNPQLPSAFGAADRDILERRAEGLKSQARGSGLTAGSRERAVSGIDQNLLAGISSLLSNQALARQGVQTTAIDQLFQSEQLQTPEKQAINQLLQILGLGTPRTGSQFIPRTPGVIEDFIRKFASSAGSAGGQAAISAATGGSGGRAGSGASAGFGGV